MESIIVHGITIPRYTTHTYRLVHGVVTIEATPINDSIGITIEYSRGGVHVGVYSHGDDYGVTLVDALREFVVATSPAIAEDVVRTIVALQIADGEIAQVAA